MRTDKNQIPNNDYLDILYEGRNKQYGSYELRKHYPERMRNSTLYGLGLVALLIIAQAITNRVHANGKNIEPPMRNITLTDPPPIEPHRVPPPPPPPPPPPVKPTLKFTPPVVIKDKDVPKDELPPEQKDLRTVTISNQTHDGDSNGLGPIGDKLPGTGIIEHKEEIPKWVEQMPAFPGDVSRYLSSSIQYPAVARDNNIAGRVVVNFIVSEDGSISNVQVVKGIGGGCDEEAKRVVSGMPKWKPGKQNGRAVKVSFTLPILFKLE